MVSPGLLRADDSAVAAMQPSSPQHLPDCIMTTSRSSTKLVVAAVRMLLIAGHLAYSAASTSRPNFIVVQADDFPWVLSWSEAPVNADFFPRNISTPHMNRIRDEGVIFSKGYVISPKCAQSRFSTLTSKLNSRGASQRLQSSFRPEAVALDMVYCDSPSARLRDIDLEEENIAHAMKAAGYRTGMTGKWHLAASGPVSADSLGRQGQLNYSATQMSIKQAGFEFAEGVFAHNIPPGASYSHNLEWITSQAQDFIDQSQEQGKPFFLYFNPTTPHDPNNYQAMFYWNMTTTPAGELDEAPVSGMPSRESVWERAKEVLTAEEIAAELAASPTSNNVSKTTPGSLTAGCIWTDDAIGAIYEHLVDRGILNNTVIILLNDHGMDDKDDLGEGGIRTMFTVRYPPVFNPGADDRMISNLDIAPTIVDIAGLDAPYDMDGRSFATMDPAGHQAVFSEILFDRALSTQHFKYRETTLAADINNTDLFLFDLTSDPAEEVNLISDPHYSQVAQAMASWMACYNDHTALSISGISPVVRLASCGVVGTPTGTSPSVQYDETVVTLSVDEIIGMEDDWGNSEDIIGSGSG